MDRKSKLIFRKAYKISQSLPDYRKESLFDSCPSNKPARSRERKEGNKYLKTTYTKKQNKTKNILLITPNIFSLMINYSKLLKNSLIKIEFIVFFSIVLYRNWTV